MALINCEFIGEALIVWLGQASQGQRDALCDALGCGPTDEEIAKVFLDCDEVVHIPGNTIPTCDQMNAAIAAAITEISFQNGTVIMSGSGTAQDPYVPNVFLDPAADNMITGDASTGLYVAPEIPVGGTPGQVLARDNSNGLEWIDIPDPIPAGGTDGQVLSRDGTNGLEWRDVGGAIDLSLWAVGDHLLGTEVGPACTGGGTSTSTFACKNSVSNTVGNLVAGGAVMAATVYVEEQDQTTEGEGGGQGFYNFPVPRIRYAVNSALPGTWRAQGAAMGGTGGVIGGGNTDNVFGSVCIYRRIL